MSRESQARTGGRSTRGFVTLLVRLRCFTEREGDTWIAGCPSLDVYSQGDSQKEARESIEEAVKLWFASCLERNTLAQAMQELDFKPVSSSQIDQGDEIITMVEEPAADDLGDAFEVAVEIPAYQAAMFSESRQRLSA